MGTNDLSVVLDHRLEVRTQKKTSCIKKKITAIADGPAGHWLPVNLCEDAEERCNCACTVDTYETSLIFPK